MSKSRDELAAHLEALKVAYAQRLPARVSAIASEWLALQERWNSHALRELYRKVHILVGSGETFGSPLVGERARALEHALMLLMDRTPPSATDRAAISAALERLRESVHEHSTIATPAAAKKPRKERRPRKSRGP